MLQPYAMLCYAKSLQSCPTLCDPIDGSPPSSPVPGILQARTLEWVAISFSNAWKWKVKVKSLSRVQLLVTPWTAAHQAPPSMEFSRQEYWSGVPLPSPAPTLEWTIYPRNMVLFLLANMISKTTAQVWMCSLLEGSSCFLAFQQTVWGNFCLSWPVYSHLSCVYQSTDQYIQIDKDMASLVAQIVKNLPAMREAGLKKSDTAEWLTHREREMHVRKE